MRVSDTGANDWSMKRAVKILRVAALSLSLASCGGSASPPGQRRGHGQNRTRAGEALQLVHTALLEDQTRSI
jgi:hypothetical protein